MKSRKIKILENSVFSIIVRYTLLLLFVLTNIFSFFIPQATIKASFYVFNLFSEATLTDSTITLQGYSFEIVPACIALSAYYLLLILNLSTQMPFRKRIYSILSSLSLLFLINIFRILLFSFLFIASESLFYKAHFITWFFISSFIVFLIWIFNVKIFRIKEIPVYSDIKFLVRMIKYKH